jgi:hypothetical protein
VNGLRRELCANRERRSIVSPEATRLQPAADHRPIEQVVIAHGDGATHDGAAFVRRGFTWLLGHAPTL